MARITFSFTVAIIVACYLANQIGEFFAGVVHTLP